MSRPSHSTRHIEVGWKCGGLHHDPHVIFAVVSCRAAPVMLSPCSAKVRCCCSAAEVVAPTQELARSSSLCKSLTTVTPSTISIRHAVSLRVVCEDSEYLGESPPEIWASEEVVGESYDGSKLELWCGREVSSESSLTLFLLAVTGCANASGSDCTHLAQARPN